MKITILQTNIAWNDVEENIHRAEQLINAKPNSDLYVLPEMWATGFYTNPEPDECQTSASKALRWMQHVAHIRKCNLAGSLAVYENGRFYNRFCWVKPNGEVSSYDKRHLFILGTESKNFTPGSERIVVEAEGLRFLPVICYDLRFPVWIRNRKDYDVMLCVANWPTARREAWNVLLRARALENQCYVVAAGRVGNDPYVSYSGGSQFVDYEGRVVAQAPDNESSAITLELSKQSLQKAREKFRVLDDADSFMLDK